MYLVFNTAASNISRSLFIDVENTINYNARQRQYVVSVNVHLDSNLQGGGVQWCWHSVKW